MSYVFWEKRAKDPEDTGHQNVVKTNSLSSNN